MEQRTQFPRWIAAYLDWAGMDDAGSAPIDDRDPGVEFCNAYLNWLEACAPAGLGRQLAGNRAGGRRAGDPLDGAEGYREAVLLAALHAQSDCLHILRRVLDHGPVDKSTIRLASEALDHAQRLLDDERHAWHALDALRAAREPRQAAGAPQRPGAGEWPQTLEHVASEVRSLTSTVLALQVH
jgi:hypothetical protein